MCGTSNSKIKNCIAPVCLMLGFLYGDTETNNSATFEKRENIICVSQFLLKGDLWEIQTVLKMCLSFQKEISFMLLCNYGKVRKLEGWLPFLNGWSSYAFWWRKKQYLMEKAKRMNLACLLWTVFLYYFPSLKEKSINLFKTYLKNWFASARDFFLLILSWRIDYPR